MKKIKKMKFFLLKGIITKSVQIDAGTTFVRIRNSHEANGPFLQKRFCDQEPDRPQEYSLVAKWQVNVQNCKRMILRPVTGQAMQKNDFATRSRDKKQENTTPSFCLFLPSRLVQCVDMNKLCDEPRVSFVSFHPTNCPFCRYELPTPN